jgi:hypothetical protein
MSNTLLHRYPGIRSFEAAEQDLFFGRSEEIRNLYAQVKTLKLVVLFSKSGIGKSSLLNAGLVPLLELDPYIPLKIRLQDTSISPSEAVKNALQHLVDKAVLERQSGPLADSRGFWETLRSCRFERYGEPATPVLIFDQFEEFFLHPEPARKEFLHDLADLISDRLPNRVRDHLLSIPIEQRTKENMAWHNPVKIKVVMAIRSDRLSLLDDMSVEIPLILHNRFQLKPLQRRQASEAITEPAALPGANFATPPFTYRQETIDLILDELKNKDQEIEPFQLQLICQDIERKVMVSNVASLVKSIEIDHYFVSSREDIQSIINNYYEKSIAALPDQYEERTRNFIETGLIVGGRRVGVNEEVAKEHFGIVEELLWLLVDSRLVRIENTHLGRSIEVSHDALVEPILQSYEKRRIRLEQEAAKKAQEEHAQMLAEEVERRTREQQLAHEQRLRKRSRFFAVVTSILALIGIIGWGVAKFQADEVTSALSEAIENKAQAEQYLKEAQSAIQKYKVAELNLARTKVDIYLNARQPQMALGEIAKARTIDSTATWIQDKEKQAEIVKRELIILNNKTK